MRLLAILTLLALALFTTGCGFSAQGNMIRAGVAHYGAQANDEGLQNALWYSCNGVSVGAIRRWIGSDLARARAWRTVCEGTLDFEALVGELPADGAGITGDAL